MDAVLESKIVKSGWLNLAIWAHCSISGVKIQQALFRIPHSCKIKNILCAHMHAHVCFFQRVGNPLRLPHQLLHILFCPRDLFKTLAPPTSLQLLKTCRVRYGISVTSLFSPPNTGGSFWVKDRLDLGGHLNRANHLGWNMKWPKLSARAERQC